MTGPVKSASLAAAIVAITAASLSGSLGCRIFEPSNHPVDTCSRSCATHAKKQCNERECERGCQFILDRLVEKEGDRVISCVARQDRRCGDPVWAECAAMIGPHIDGGPPGPPPPDDEW